MNTSQFMDKQIMDLASQGSIPSKDFIDLANHPEEDLDRTAATAGGGGGGGGGSGRNGNIDEDDGVKREEILPSYDFQPIRPIAVSDMPSLGFDGGSARAWGSADSKANASTPVRSYSSFDTFEPAKVIVEKDKNAFDATILSEIDRTMKKHADNLLHALEGVSARLTQLESKTHNLENSVDDLKASVGNNYGSADGKMRHLENILTEVQAGVQVLKDKQEIIEAQYQLAKLQVPMAGQQQDTQKTSHVGSVQSISSVPPQPPQQTPASFQQSLPALPTSNAPPHPLPHQNLPPPVQLPSQFPQTQVPPGPQRESYFPPPAQAQETSNQQYQVPPLQQPPAPPGPTHQQYQTVPPPQFSQPPPPPPQHTSVAPANPPQQPLGRHPEDNTYIPPQTYPPSLHQPPAQPLSGPPPSQQFYGTTPQMYEPPSSRPSSGFSAPYGHPSGPSEMQYGGSQYGTSPPMKSQQHSQSGGVGYPQLPTARVLPHALPTASAVSSGSGSGGTGNRVPIDDVVDKVTSMGFPREHVRATVRRLTENGQPVDLNIVLDKLMNDSDIQPPRGWFGR